MQKEGLKAEMKDSYVITISRQFGSMGRPIACELSQRLGIPFYDRDIVEETAKRMGLPISVVSDKEEVSNFPYLRYLYPLGMVVPSMQDEIFQIEKNIIMDLADKGPCILVGRCADSILAERKNHFSIYIYASYENRLKNCCEYFEMEKAAAEKMIVDADHSRTLYHKRYSKGYHSELDYKDVALNSGSFGVKGSAEILEAMIRNWLNC